MQVEGEAPAAGGDELGEEEKAAFFAHFARPRPALDALVDRLLAASP